MKQRTREGPSLRFYILLPLTLLLVISISAFVYSSFWNEQSQTADEVKKLHIMMQQLYEVTLQLETEKLAAALSLLKDNPRLQQAFAAKDRQQLLEQATPIFEQLSNTGRISHFYFHDIERVNFLRIHQPDRFGDSIDRLTLRNAEATGKLQSGIELGPLGTFTLRAVLPWYQGERLIGYLELGEEIGHMFNQMSKLQKIDLAITIDKEFLTREGWETGINLRPTSAKWDQLSTSVITYHTLHGFPDEFLEKPHPGLGIRIEMDNQFYQMMSLPLRDAGNRKVGHIFHLHDVTDPVHNTQRNVAVVTLLTITLGIAVFILFYVLTGRVEARLIASRLRIIEEGEQREAIQIKYVAELEQEVTARQRAESVLAENNASLEHLLLASPAVIYTSSAEGNFGATFISKSVEKMLGYEAQAFVGDSSFWLDHIHPNDREHVLRELTEGFDNQQQTLEYRFQHKDGRYHWVHDGMRLMHDENNEPREIVGYWVDISEQKKMESEWVDAQQRLSLHFEQTPLGVIEWNPALKVIAWNSAAEKIFGYSEQEAIDQQTMTFVIPENALQQVKESWHKLLTDKGGNRSTSENVTKEGQKIYCEWYNTVLTDAQDNVIGVVSLVEDITERKRIEASNIRTNRALKTLSECNMALVRSRETDIFQQDICQILVDSGGYRLAWIGYITDEPANTIRIVSQAGEQSKCLNKSQIHLDSGAPIAAAIRTGKTQIIQHSIIDSDSTPCINQLGCHSCIALPLSDEEHVYGAISIHAFESDAFDPEEVELLEELAGDLAYGIRARRYRSERNSAQGALTTVLMETVDAIARTVEKRDPYTAGHQHRVSQLAIRIAAEMGMDENRIEGLRLGATIHDIGKIYIPAEILNRPGRLTEHEFGMIQTHSQVGYDIVEGVHFPWPVKEMILQHHERLDGSGYPQGLKGEEIILEARIIAVADVAEAITSHRPYRPSLGIDKALEIIHQEAGVGLDREIVNICLRLFKDGGFKWS